MPEIHVRVLALDPLSGREIPVPGALVRVKNSEFFIDPDLSNPTAAGADGLATIPLTVAADRTDLNPYFEIELPAAARTVPAAGPGVTAERRFELPEAWQTVHHEGRQLPRIFEMATAERPLPLYVGLPALLRFAYADFDPAGNRNPLALPAETARVFLADWDRCSRDETLGGFAADLAGRRIVPVGGETRYPFSDPFPTEPQVGTALVAQSRELLEPPRARLEPPGFPIATLGGGSFERVGTLATDSQGMVFMIDDHRIRRFYPDGTLAETLTLPGNATPTALALDRARDLYVAEADGNRVHRFSRETSTDRSAADFGRYAHRFSVNFWRLAGGDLTDFPERLDRPVALAVAETRQGKRPGELLLIAERARVVGLQLPLEEPTTRASLGSETAGFPLSEGGANPFTRPTALAALRDGRFVVADGDRHQVSRWRLDDERSMATREALWGDPGGAPGVFDTPEALGWDGNRGFVYVLESGNRRIQRLRDSDGSSLVVWEPSPDAAALAIDTRGEIYVASGGAEPRVSRFTAWELDGTPRAEASEPRPTGPPWAPRSDRAHMSEPAYAHFDPEGRLWVADSGNNRVLRFERNADGRLVSAGEPLTEGLDRPQAVAVGDDGHIFVSDTGNSRIRCFDAELAHVADISAGLSEPRGLAVTRIGGEPAVVVADAALGQVIVVRPDGTVLKRFEELDGQRLNGPEDVAVTSHPDLYIADTGTQRVLQMIDLEGQIERDRPLATPIGFAAGFTQPSGVAIDEFNALVVTDRMARKIFQVSAANGDLRATWDLENLPRINRSETPTAFLEPELARRLLFAAPTRAAVDSTGLLAVADTGHDHVRLIRIRTHLDAHLTNLDERRPDLSLRLYADADWRPELALRAAVGIDTDALGEALAIESDPERDYSRDRVVRLETLGSGNRLNEAVNAMRVIRHVQRWLVHHTAADDPDERWGATERVLFGDIETEVDFSFVTVGKDILNLSADTTGRGHDAWDESTIAHEAGHWHFNNSMPGALRNSFHSEERDHVADQVIGQNAAMIEGYADYLQLHWGQEFDRSDRVRGFPRSTLEDIGPGESGTRTSLYESAGRGLQNEGYFANALWQIHHAIADPAVLFADAPGYWYPFNTCVTEPQGRRLVDLLRRPLREFDIVDHPAMASSRFLLRVLERAAMIDAEVAQVVQSILELNNLLMPVLAIRQGGAAVSEIEVPAGGSREVEVAVADAAGRSLRGYNLRFHVEPGDPAHFRLPAGPGPAVLRGAGAEHFDFATGSDRLRATTAAGQVAITVEAPADAAGEEETLTVSYRPDFATDATFAPPQSEADWDATLCRLFLNELGTTGPTNRYGAAVTAALRVRIV